MTTGYIFADSAIHAVMISKKLIEIISGAEAL
jgi:hypothetical protein